MNNEDLVRFNAIMKFMYDMAIAKSQKYGDSWKIDGLGPKSLFVEINAKFQRLRHLLWEEGIHKKDPEEIHELMTDIGVYSILLIMKMELEMDSDMTRKYMEAIDARMKSNSMSIAQEYLQRVAHYLYPDKE